MARDASVPTRWKNLRTLDCRTFSYMAAEGKLRRPVCGIAALKELCRIPTGATFILLSRGLLLNTRLLGMR